MNEQAILRIQQLAEQADNFTIENFGTSLNLQDTKKWLQDTKEWQCIRDAKFAELIANECASIAMTKHIRDSSESYDEYSWCYDRGSDDTASSISGNIRNCFGVK